MIDAGDHALGSVPADDFLRLLTLGFKSPQDVLLVVLGLYVDESADDATYAACGVLASVGAWDSFIHQWNEILAIEPAMPFWHQSDVWAGNPPFDKLSRDEIRERELFLALAIRNLEPRIIATAIKASDYHREKVSWISSLDLSRRRARKNWERDNDPYHVIHGPWIEQLQRDADAFAPGERALVVIEKSNDSARDAATLESLGGWNGYYTNRGQRDFVHSISFAKGKCAESRQLEAADMACWVVRRCLSQNGEHHLQSLILNQLHPVRYMELEGQHIRGHFDLMARIGLIKGITDA